MREKLTAIAKPGFDSIKIFEQDFIVDEGCDHEIPAIIRDHAGLPRDPYGRAFDRARYKFAS
ncbi:hypothetical protein [Pseudoprimorskyibacter insulae]|uniref:hypothetical protein n=1 Tax=Pseudoprimorskyibacter insulae TaxID=1695997 RepID=UPI001C63560E|nr:hypothetical protein [Pseudoprimorskyibacter insulae]